MTKFISIILVLACSLQVGIAQNDKSKSKTLSPEATKELMKAIQLDTLKILREHATTACHCIDSFMQARKAGDSNSVVVREISSCIDKEVTVYQMVMKINQPFTSPDKNITINVDKNSPDYTRYYRDIETWLADSCASLRAAMSSNEEKETELSFSNDPEAVKQYNLGIKHINKEEYADALPYFKKAVEADPKFVYALDNLAICYRRTGELDKALTIYNRSLELSPKGKTPLQNIPVVYELKKDYPKAMEGYKKLLHYYPDDAEAYYGMGRICIGYTDDLENGVDYMCKAYNIYTKNKSPYRVDAQTNISVAYKRMKELGKEEVFFKILKDNNISVK